MATTAADAEHTVIERGALDLYDAKGYRANRTPRSHPA
jgi:hypothetical protein